MYFQETGDLATETLQYLSSRTPVPHLFPRLTRLSVYLGGFGQSFADMLVGPQLKAIVIANGDEMSALTLLEKVRSIAGPLESIIMQFDTPSSTRIDETLASIISRSRHLRSLVLKNQTIPPDLFAHVAAMTSLQKLSFNIANGSSLARILEPARSTPFAALRSLQLVVYDLQSSSVIASLEAAEVPHLQDFSIECKEQPCIQDLQLLFQGISTHRGIHSLYITLPGTDNAEDADPEFLDLR